MFRMVICLQCRKVFKVAGICLAGPVQAGPCPTA